MAENNPRHCAQVLASMQRRRYRLVFFLFAVTPLTLNWIRLRNREALVQVHENQYEKQNTPSNTQPVYTQYLPGRAEEYIIKNADSLGFNTTGQQNAATCRVWKSASISPIYQDLHDYLAELKEYNRRVDGFALDGNVTDLRDFLDDNYKVCQKVELDKGGLKAIFKSGQLSFTAAGLVEPLLPPMRHPEFCFQRARLMSLTYLVHDFGALCRKLKRTSRTIFIDMGASLLFHHSKDQPAMYLTEIYRRFGLPFDHIYAYEITPTPPEKVYQRLPAHLIPAYHWINMGVDTSTSSPLNPLNMILAKYNEDDLIIVKLDVDNPTIETTLAAQLEADDRLGRLVDHFYFEHHTHIAELARNWKTTMRGSAKDSLKLFSALRQRGIAAHYWV